jgi:hypothetical protein
MAETAADDRRILASGVNLRVPAAWRYRVAENMQWWVNVATKSVYIDAALIPGIKSLESSAAWVALHFAGVCRACTTGLSLSAADPTMAAQGIYKWQPEVEYAVQVERATKVVSDIEMESALRGLQTELAIKPPEPPEPAEELEPPQGP